MTDGSHADHDHAIDFLPNARRFTDRGFEIIADRLRYSVPPIRSRISLPAGIPSGPFEYVVLEDGTAEIIAYNGTSENVDIPDYIDGVRVSSLRAGLLSNREEVERVTLCNAITHLPLHLFDGCAHLSELVLPAHLECIGSFAFAKTGLRAIQLPETLREMGEHAFFGCSQLAGVVLPDGLEVIGNRAFARTAVGGAVLPASLRSFGREVFEATPAQERCTCGEGSVCVSGSANLPGPMGAADARGAADAAAARYDVDRFGGVYRGGVLCELIGRVERYRVRMGTHRVANGALRNHPSICEVSLPDTLRSVGSDAFRSARHLRRIFLPEGLEEMGDRALRDTSIASLRLPASLRTLGMDALLVQGDNEIYPGTPLASVEVSDGNTALYVESGLLIERGTAPGGGDLAVLYVGPDEDVRVPEAVTGIARCAFVGVTGVESLHVHAGLRSVCQGAFSVKSAIPLVTVDYPRPIDGFSGGRFPVPALTLRYRSMTLLFEGSANGTVFKFDYYDAWIAHTSDMSVFFPAAFERLEHPACLSDRARELYLGILTRRVEAALDFASAHADMEGLALLAEAGAADEGAFVRAIERAVQRGGTQAVACLLEARRRCFAPKDGKAGESARVGTRRMPFSSEMDFSL